MQTKKANNVYYDKWTNVILDVLPILLSKDILSPS